MRSRFRAIWYVALLATLCSGTALGGWPAPEIDAQAPEITLTPGEVSCSTEIVVRGEGFVPGSDVIISPGGVQDIPSSIFLAYVGPLPVDDAGSFEVTLSHGYGIFDCAGGPLGRDGAPYLITASTVLDYTGEAREPFGAPTATASFSFSPSPDDPTLSLTPNQGMDCIDVVAEGWNFEPGTTVNVVANPGPMPIPLGTTTVLADGTFTLPLPGELAPFLPCGNEVAAVVGREFVVFAFTGAGPKENDPYRYPHDATVFTVAPDAVSRFDSTWARVDKPVAEDVASRTWIWGPEPFADLVEEEYVDAPGGRRVVRYYDKSRMEVNDPLADPDDPWQVTNGLLVVEMVEGKVQTGHATFDDVPEPAEVSIAGDPGQGPAYADINAWALRDEPPHPVGDVIDARIDVDGHISRDASLTDYGVIAAERVVVEGIDHTVASPFWAFMNAEALIWTGSDYANGQLFETPFYATGYPITEAYWSRIAVDGVMQDVLWQCFERRCLTYTPDNPEGWKVEAGNVGQHYFAWRYSDDSGPEFELRFESMNGSGVTVTGGIEFEDSVMVVTMQGDGVESGSEHGVAMHGLRGDGPFYLDPQGTCPTQEHDSDGDGIITDAEGQQAYGAALVPLPPLSVREDGETFSYTGRVDADEIGWDPIGVPALRVIVLYGMTVSGAYDPSIPIACGRIIYIEPGS